MLAMLGGKLQREHHLPGQMHVHLITIPFDELPVAYELSNQGDDPAEVLVAGPEALGRELDPPHSAVAVEIGSGGGGPPG